MAQTASESKFRFADINDLDIKPERDFVARVPRGVASKASLFESLRQSLHLPQYFGHNWDALDECLRDLSWIEQRRVIIVHEDVPRLEAKGLATYLNVLSLAAGGWKSDDDHEVMVTFPKDFLDSRIRKGGEKS